MTASAGAVVAVAIAKREGARVVPVWGRRAVVPGVTFLALGFRTILSCVFVSILGMKPL